MSFGLNIFGEASPVEITAGPNGGNRSTMNNVGNRYGRPFLSLFAGLPVVTLSGPQKEELAAWFDAILSQFPRSYVKHPDGSIEFYHQSTDDRTFWSVDTRPGAVALPAEELAYITESASRNREASADLKYGGQPDPFIDWNHGGDGMIDKLYSAIAEMKHKLTD